MVSPPRDSQSRCKLLRDNKSPRQSRSVGLPSDGREDSLITGSSEEQVDPAKPSL
jgi:hypothetical protein